MSWGNRDDGDPAFLRLEDIEHLPGAGPEQLGLGHPAHIAAYLRISGIGSTPVSAMRPANTDTTDGTSGLRASATPATCFSVNSAVTLSLTLAAPAP